MADDHLCTYTPGPVWEMRPGESAWYGRFLLFLRMGQARSVSGVYRLEQEQAGELDLLLPDSLKQWRKVARLFHWVDRAAAWDAAEYERADEAVGEARSIIKAASPRAAEVLFELLEDPDPARRKQAAEIILKWSGAAVQGPAAPPPSLANPIRIIDFSGELIDLQSHR